MNPIGANTWIWVSPLTDDRLATLGPRICDLGFDVVELPIEDPGDWDAGRAADLLADLGLGATTCAVMPDGRSLVSDDPAVVASTQAYLGRCVRMAQRVGAGVVGGPIYSPVGLTWLLGPEDRRATIARLVEALRGPADDAAAHGVVLGLEPLNRYETSLVNTVEQALEIVEALDSPGCAIQLDTFHMNIEEKDVTAAVEAAGKSLYHLHACENDRGAPGSGQVRWKAWAKAVKAAKYDGAVVIESFTPEVTSIAKAAAIWRKLAPSQDRLASDGLKFLKKLLKGVK